MILPIPFTRLCLRPSIGSSAAIVPLTIALDTRFFAGLGQTGICEAPRAPI